MALPLTHYDNLKVAPNAPTEVIRAAYRVLSQRYHPDVNTSPDAGRVMKLLNEAWRVLGDPTLRAAHDAWIAEQLAESVQAKFRSTTQAPSHPRESSNTTHQSSSPLNSFNTWLANADRKVYVAIALTLFGGLAWLLSSTSSNAPSGLTPPIAARPEVSKATPLPPAQPASTEPEKTTFTFEEARGQGPRDKAARSQASAFREFTGDLDPPTPSGSTRQPNTAWGTSDELATPWSPNGRPWSPKAGYLKGMRQLSGGGLSKLTIDNTNGGSDVYVKLCSSSRERCDGLRHVFIPLGSSFTIGGIASGTYDVRYRDLSSGKIAKSEPILVRQVEEDRGTKFSVVRLTLYRVSGGNTSFSPLSEEQF